jgi:hypothetical protein
MKNTTTTKSTIKPRTSSSVRKTPATKTAAPVSLVDVIRATTVEQRTAMIAEAAYYIAERSGFNSAHAVDCWLEAEKQIDAKILDLDN